jgi:hypothetical protein
MVHLATASILALVATAQAVQVTFENQCSHDIDLYDNKNTQTIATGANAQRTLGAGFSGMFRHGKGDQATLAEFSISGGKTWFDISAVAPGSGYCKSHADCKQVSKKSGFNVALSIVPETDKQDNICRTLTCETEDCADAYLFPTDDHKTHDCPESVPMKVVFCPNGDGQASTAAPATTATATTAATAATAAPQTNSASSNNTNAFTQDSSYKSGVVTSNNNASTSGSAVSFPNAEVKGSFTYSGKLAGNTPGTYQMVTNAETCSRQTVSVNSPVGPMSEEATMVFRGPMNIYNIAVFDGSQGGDWKRVSSYSSSNGQAQDLVFMNNKNIDYSGGKKSPQGFATSDGAKKADSSMVFAGKLAEASDPSQIGGGPGIQTGVEVNIMREAKCSDDKTCKGYYDSNGHHGWGGGKKMFVSKVMMPTGSKPNQPAVWMLNAQIVRSSQYQCNCRGMGGVGGCGELDVAEVIETNAARDRVSTHYYFLDGSIHSGRDNFAARPTNAATTYLTIIDDDGEGTIQILEIGENDFDFSASAVTEAQIKTWLGASASSSAKQQ